MQILDTTVILPTAGASVLTPNITLAAGTNNNSMKVTVGFFSGALGSDQWTVGWEAKIITTGVEPGNLDWDGDIKFL